MTRILTGQVAQNVDGEHRLVLARADCISCWYCNFFIRNGISYEASKLGLGHAEVSLWRLEPLWSGLSENPSLQVLSLKQEASGLDSEVIHPVPTSDPMHLQYHGVLCLFSV